MISLPTGAGKTRVAIEGLIEADEGRDAPVADPLGRST